MFGKEGISQTQATSLANKNAERARQIDIHLAAVSPITIYVLIDGEKHLHQQQNFEMDVILALLEEKADLHQFSAWLREAVSIKTETIESIQGRSYVATPKPVKPPAVTASQVLREFNVRERADYLGLEAAAAVYGKILHDGPIRKWQNEVHVEGVSKKGDTVFICPIEKRSDQVNTVADYVFQKHAELTRELNKYKARIEKRVNELNAKMLSEHFKAMAQWQHENELAQNEFEREKLEEIREIASRKIIVPEKFRGLLDADS